MKWKMDDSGTSTKTRQHIERPNITHWTFKPVKKTVSPLCPFVSRVLVDFSCSYNSCWVSSVRVKSCSAFRSRGADRQEQWHISQHNSRTKQIDYSDDEAAGCGGRDLWCFCDYPHNLGAIRQLAIFSWFISLKLRALCVFPDQRSGWPVTPQLHQWTSHLAFPQTGLSRKEERKWVVEKH